MGEIKHIHIQFFKIALSIKFTLIPKTILMQAGLFAKKIGMTQIFDESGTILPVTILKVGLCRVSQLKTVVSDGYNAVQVAYGKQNLKRLNRSTLGQLKKSCFDGTDL